MRAIRSNPSRPLRREDRDYSKRREYVRADLAIRAITAAGIVIIGAASWFLQRHVSRESTDADSRSRRVRQYVPEIRTLVDLELLLADTSHFEEDGSVAGAALLNRGRELINAGHGLFLPDENPLVEVDVPNLVKRSFVETSKATMTVSDNPQRKRLRLPLRGLTVMYGELMIATAIARGRAHYVCIRTSKFGKPELYTIPYSFYDDQSEIAWPISDQSIDAWRSWFSGCVMSNQFVEYCDYFDIDQLRQQVTSVTQQIVIKYPELGNEYVNIRSASYLAWTSDSQRSTRIRRGPLWLANEEKDKE